MDRRAFLGTLASGVLAVPFAAGAQQARVYRVGSACREARIRQPSAGSGRVSQS
jgi:hypothetical protein